MNENDLVYKRSLKSIEIAFFAFILYYSHQNRI